jgi:hypothetical protein
MDEEDIEEMTLVGRWVLEGRGEERGRREEVESLGCFIDS